VTTLAKTAISNSAAPGVLGFIIVFGIAVALVFIFRSMSKHIRKVNEAARRDEEARAAAGDAPDPATADDYSTDGNTAGRQF
jgi:Na+-transporting methylmalonyl-CoA/oxaloacetate decarboxylase gamma subunit